MANNSAKVQRLTFSAFRGATQPAVFKFRATEPVILIFGENGTGKSTIADALDFICNGEFGSIRLRSGTTPRTHIISAGGSANDLAVEMICGGNTWRATLQKGKPVTTPDAPPRAFVLRRADITRIMEETDSERYKSLKSFITVPQIESAEGTLRSLCRLVSRELDQAIQQKSTAETTLSNFWQAEGRPGADALTWARLSVSQPIAHWKTQLQADREIVQAIRSATEAEEKMQVADAAFTAARSRQDDLQTQIEQISHSQVGGDLLQTLEAARSYLRNHPETTECPVCKKPEPQPSLLAQIDAQLERMRQLQSLRQNLEASSRSMQQAQGVYSHALENRRKAHTALVAQLQAGPDFLASLVSPISAEAAEIDTQALLAQVAAQRPALDKRISVADKAIDQHNALATHLATIDELNEKLGKTDALSRRLHAMLDIVEEERKKFVKATVEGISASVSELYDRIHPKEPVGKPSFDIKRNVTSSLTLTGTFGDNTEIPPAAYYSEAHLDTLGLCVYLALAKQSGNALVVLDDVLTSIDDPHMDRVIELINDEAPSFGHVIITTHSRAWFDRMRMGNGVRAELIELYGWDLQNGMNHSAAPLAVDELRAAVQSPKMNRQSVASQAGILLEQLLDDLTLRYSCSMPRKPRAEYTLGELSQAIDKKLRPLLRTEHLDAAGNLSVDYKLYPLIEASTQDMLIRNLVGAHFNPNAAGIADTAVRQFGEKVLALADAMLCPHCKQLARQDKTGSYWQCGGGCGKLRLHPLRSPS